MLPPSGNPNKSHSIPSKIRHPRPNIWSLSLPSWKRKIPSIKQPLLQTPSQSWEYSNPGLACDTDYFTRNGPDHFKVSLLSPVAQAMQKVDTSKMLFYSKCVHSNSDVCCLKDLLNYCGYIFPLQTIKTTSNPEKDKTSPLVVIEEKAPSLFS